MRHVWTADELAAISEAVKTRRVEEIASAWRVHPKALRSMLRRKGVSIRAVRADHKALSAQEFGIVARRPVGYAAAKYGAEALEHLEDGCCSFPIGDPSEPGFCYCGAPAALGRSYCTGHIGIAYEPAEPPKYAKSAYASPSNDISAPVQSRAGRSARRAA